MTLLHTSFVLGYHGCDEAVGNALVSGITTPVLSEKDYDWLGPGFYLWESDPKRAWEWAEEKKDRNPTFSPFVVGAVVDLGNCLDLTNREDLDLVKKAYDGLRETMDADGVAMPVNRDLRGDKHQDKLLRNLDCAVITYLHDSLDNQAGSSAIFYDTVRGLFQEGGELFPGSSLREKTHTQIAVRNLICIKGLFSAGRSG